MRPKRICASGRRRSSRWRRASRRPPSPAAGCSAPAPPIPCTPGSIGSRPPGSRASPSTLGADGSPLFPPACPDAAAAQTALLHVVRREPRAFGVPKTRWTLGDLHAVCDWLRLHTAGGLSRLLARLELSWQRARDYVHSPDPDYDAKRTTIADLVAQGQAAGSPIVTLYLDELTYYRQPSLAGAWAAQGTAQPRAQRSYRSNTATRLLGTLDVRDGRVVYYQGARVGPQELVRFYQQLRAAYPTAARLYVVQDN